jgi:phosphatidylinositol alpha-mannosyltransferase
VVTLDRYRRTLLRQHRARNVRHIPHGAWEAPRPLPETAEENILVLGTFGPHKDPQLVADAVAVLRSRRPGLRLLLAGAAHPRYPGFLDPARYARQLGEAFEWLGYVPAEQLAAVFARTAAAVLPARAASGSSGVLYRAAGFGRPVLVSDLPDYRALAGEEDLRLVWFSPGDARGLAEALDGLLSDPARRAALAGHNLCAVARRTPAATAAAYLEAFRAVVPQPALASSAGHNVAV